MDARLLVTVLLTLFLGTAISLKGAQASTEECSDITPERIEVALSATIAGIICDYGTEWSIGSNLCDPSSFTEYSNCSGKYACNVPASEYLVEGPTYVICRAGLQPVLYFEILITPTTIHQVPPVVIAGKREQVHTIITSKPRPSPADTLGVAIDLIIQNMSIVPLGIASTELVSDPTNVTRFIAIHTFDVPSDIDEESEAVFIRFHFTEPGTWTRLDHLAQVVPVVAVPREVPPSVLPADTMEPPTEGGVGTLTTSDCYGAEILSVAAILPTIFTALVSVTITLLVVYLNRRCVCSLKGKQSKYVKAAPPTTAALSRNNLSLFTTIASPATTCSTLSTPALGYTPTSETASLFPGPGPDRSGGSTVAGETGPASSNGIMNSGFQRQCSRDSNSTNSPTDADRLLSVADSNVSTNNLTTSVGLSVSTGTTCSGGIMPELRPVTFESDQNRSPPSASSTLDRDSLRAKSGDSATAVVQEYLEPTSFSAKGLQGSTQTHRGAGNDPRYHTYSTISEAVNQVAAISTVHHHHSLTTGSGRQLPANGRGSGSAEPSLQLSLQTQQNYEMHNSGSRVPMPSLTTATHPISTSAETLISPPPPSADPNYSTGGRNMHLLPQYNCDQPNATNV